MSLSNTMLDFKNWGDEFRYSGANVIYAWSGQRRYVTNRHKHQDFVWIKNPKSNIKVVENNKLNRVQKNNRGVFGVDEPYLFYDDVLETAGLTTIVDNTPLLNPSGPGIRDNYRFKLGVNRNHVVEAYQVVNQYYDPQIVQGEQWYGFSKYDYYAGLEIQFSEASGGKLVRIATPAYFGPSQNWEQKVAISDRRLYPGVVHVDSDEYVITDPFLWAAISEAVYLLTPECCA